MTALSIPVALAIALHCAPAEDPGMLVGIARQESGLETMTLHDNTSGRCCGARAWSTWRGG